MTAARDSCEWMQRHIDAYTDGELDEADRVRLEEHVDLCLDCRQSVAQAFALVASLRALPVPTCPAAVGDAIDRAVRARETRQPAPMARSERNLRRFAPGIAIAAAIAIALLWFQDTTTPRVAPSYSAEQVAQAERELRLAFAYVADLNQTLATQVRDDIVRPCIVHALEAPLAPNECAKAL